LNEIVISNSELDGNRRLTSRVTPPQHLRKYFRSLDFFATYDADIAAGRSILNIPLLATVLPFAWLVGADIYVDELDRTFKESMDELKHVFMQVHPDAPFTTRILVDTLVENEIGVVDPWERTGLLFSGGVDSTHSLLTNLTLCPHLLMLWGTETYPYPENAAQWEMIISTYARFAKRMGVKFHVVKTNNSVILDDLRISHDFHQFLYDGWFRLVLQHTFVLLPLVAPLSLGRFDRLLISGDMPVIEEDGSPPNPNRPETNEKFTWADLTIKHIGDMYREEKIRGAIKDYLQTGDLQLKVCLRKLDKPQLNDNTCVKCLCTIADLVKADIDPNTCGFHVDETTWIRFKEYFKHDLEQETFGGRLLLTFFENMQQTIPATIDHDFYGSRAFFNWFRDFDLKSKEKNAWFYRDIYNSLPFPLARLLDKVYSIVGIKIHDVTPIPRQKTASPPDQADHRLLHPNTLHPARNISLDRLKD
jgi:hypothetical protein